MSVPRSRHARHVLVDSSAFYAFVNQKSEHYTRAVDAFTGFATSRQHLFTTNFVVAETHALVLNRMGYYFASRALEWIDGSDTTIVRITEDDEFRGREIIFSHTDKDYSLTDATSFAVMERLRIGTAFSFDRDFSRYGFATLGLEGS